MHLPKPEETLANEVWVEVRDSRLIHSKFEIRDAVYHNSGIWRQTSTLFDTAVRRILENKAAAKGSGYAYIQMYGCCFVTKDEDLVLAKVLRDLRYQITHGESLANLGNGVNVLQRSTSPVAREIGLLASLAGSQAKALKLEIERIDAVAAPSFGIARARGRARFEARRALVAP